jgi:hypothetical protein
MKKSLFSFAATNQPTNVQHEGVDPRICEFRAVGTT